MGARTYFNAFCTLYTSISLHLRIVEVMAADHFYASLRTDNHASATAAANSLIDNQTDILTAYLHCWFIPNSWISAKRFPNWNCIQWFWKMCGMLGLHYGLSIWSDCSIIWAWRRSSMWPMPWWRISYLCTDLSNRSVSLCGKTRKDVLTWFY